MTVPDQMATSSLDTRHAPGEASTEDGRSRMARRRAAPFGPVLALTVTLAVACFLVCMALLLLAVHPDVVNPGFWFGPQQNQSAKTALYLVAFAVILPLALVVGPRLADSIATGPNALALAALASALACSFAAAILIARISGALGWADGLSVVLALVGIWVVCATAVLARAAKPRPWRLLLRAADSARHLPVLAGLLVFGTLLALTSVRSLSALPLALGTVVVAGAVFVHQRGRLPQLTRGWGAVIDAMIIGVLLLALPDMVIFETSSAPLSTFFPPGVYQWHHDFLLGPANQQLAGGALLVDNPVSQYGVGSIYFLVAWFQLAPIGYGTLGLLDGILTAFFYAAGYSALRIAGATRLLAGLALLVGTIALVYNLPHPVGGIPQDGPLRFGLPMVLLLATLVGARWPRTAGAARVAGLTVLGIASVWALEAFAYTAVTFAALAALHASLLPPGGRLRWMAREALVAAVACLCAHLILAAATLAATAELPDWGQYVAYLQAFLLGGDAGEIVFGFEPWPPALALGAAYLASASAVVLLLRRRFGMALRERTALLAIAGMTAYGVALLSYISNRSATHLLPYVALPALLMGALWLSLLLRSGPAEVGGRARLGSLVFAASLAVVLVAAAWPSAGDRFARSPLALARPGGELLAHINRLWDPPPIDARAPEGQRLIARYMPGQLRSLILFPQSPDLAVEILMRSGRANRLPLGDSVEEGFVPMARVPALRQAIAELRPGERLLTDRKGLRAFAKLKADPAIDPLAKPVYQYRLDEWILQRIGERFRLRPIAEGRAQLIVVELVADRTSRRE
jgi:hypothetical protein